MVENKLTIIIDKPVELVFEFTINPQNTHKWIDSIKKETTDTKVVALGTVYKNDFGELVVSSFVPNKVFELQNKKDAYMVTYTYTEIDKQHTELTYFEKMRDSSDLAALFNISSLEKLKRIIENK